MENIHKIVFWKCPQRTHLICLFLTNRILPYIYSPNISLSNGENRRSLSCFYQKLFNLQPGAFYFETDSSLNQAHHPVHCQPIEQYSPLGVWQLTALYAGKSWMNRSLIRSFSMSGLYWSTLSKWTGVTTHSFIWTRSPATSLFPIQQTCESCISVLVSWTAHIS
jgi:hypothetical protein